MAEGNILTRHRIAAALLGLGIAGAAGAAPSAESWPRWQAHDPASEATMDHGAWDAFLKRHRKRDATLALDRVRYGAVSGADRAALETYIRGLENTAIDDYNRDEQFAFWLNLYNAVTMDLVLDVYPVDSIRDIGGGLFGGGGPWDKEVVTVAGTPLTLNDIEHRILRPIWDHPLIHYGVNCASVGCPNLLAYTGAEVHGQLRKNARAYVNSPRGVRFTDGRLVVSKLYTWYREDFGGSEAGVISHLRRYATPALSARLDAAGGIHGYAYDWALNDVRREEN
jgi:hypothetical protein